jgi:protein ImuB
MDRGCVIACSAAARAHGIVEGLRRRQAESLCASVVLVEHDPARDVRAFEPIVVALEASVPAVEIVRPGIAAFAARGPARYYGGEEALARRVIDVVEQAGGVGCAIGIADGGSAAEQAARIATRAPNAHRALIVDEEQTQAFIATLGVEVLEAETHGARASRGAAASRGARARNAAASDDDLPAELRRLGIETLGDLAKLPADAVATRFGARGSWAHRLARGLEEEPLIAREPPPDLSVTMELDPPADRVDTVAFAARALTSELTNRLARRGLTSEQIVIEAETTRGETLSRRWRNDGLTPEALAERARWQLEAWITARAQESGDDARDADAGLRTLRLVPESLRPDRGRQLAFADERTARDEQMERVLARVQGILGEDAVATPMLTGGRMPRDRVRLVTWGEPRPDAAASARGGRRRKRPPPEPVWPGTLPAPSPATVFLEPRAADVRDADGERVEMNERGELSADPARVCTDGKTWTAVTVWAGPWPLHERWWDQRARRRYARTQMLTADGRALLMTVRDGRWYLDAVYD